MTSIQVSVRVRPFNSREAKYRSQLIVGMPDKEKLELSVVSKGKILPDDPRKFTFDHCFWSHDPASDGFVGQDQVYAALGKTVLQNSLQGFNSCLFAYGQTGSGKTYTMMGVPEDKGVIPRLCDDLFEYVEAEKATTQVVVECSFLEIYNENVRDLLNPAGADRSLRVRQHPKLGVFVEGANKLLVRSAEQIADLIDAGTKVRSVAATAMNATSSRSHAILTLRLRVKGPDNEVASQLHLVDLAGSERATSTGATGATLAEGANINKSLTTLGMCLSRLAEQSDGKGKGHIPFRDSQLTWLLNDSLGGNSRTAMLANISPADINFDETLSTLRFAATTKKIKNHAVVNEDPQQRLIRELREEISELRDQLRAFEEAAAANPGSPGVTDLLERLVENSSIFESLHETTEDKVAKADEVAAQMKALQQSHAAVFIDHTAPRLMTLNENLSVICAPADAKSVAVAYLATGEEGPIGSAEGSWCRLPVANGVGLPPSLAVLQVDNDARTLTLAAHDGDDVAGLVYVNGMELTAGDSVRLEDFDRVFFGAFAFRVMLPDAWVAADECDFETGELVDETHAALLEEFNRQNILCAWSEELVELLRAIGDGVPDVIADVEAELKETLCVMGEIDTELTQEYPSGDRDTRAVVYDYAFAHSELAAAKAAAAKAAKDAAEAQAAAEYERKMADMADQDKEHDAEIEALQAQLAMLAEEEEKSKRGAEEDAAAAQAAAAAAAAAQAVAEEEEAKAAAVVASASVPATPAMKPRPAPEDKMALAVELQAYEEMCRTCTTWQPTGPAAAEEAALYRKSLEPTTMAQFTAEGAVLYRGSVHKMRVKTGLFGRTGFHPVTIVVRDRVLAYFESTSDAAPAKSQVYYYGCEVQEMGLVEKRPAVRLIPSVPRKVGKSFDLTNALILGAANDASLAELIGVLKAHYRPKPSPLVAEYMATEEAAA